jgi:histidinol phosphatase-like enzyme (inositol monophosphatase family)
MPAPAVSPEHLAELDAFVLELNRASAAEILPLFRAEHGLEDKGGARGFDPVTRADRNAEAVIRRLVGERFPSHGVVGEEYGADRPDAEFVWVVDPIDGTRAFITGLPVWTTLIGLKHRDAPLIGSIGQPFIGEIFIGHPGGSRLVASGVERPLRTRPCPVLAEAMIATTDPALFRDEAQLAAWTSLRAAVRLARLGCDAYAYAMVAAGALDLVIETGLKSWDIEAARALLAGAGGIVADWRGEPIGGNGGQMLIAGDPACLAAAAALVKDAALP